MKKIFIVLIVFAFVFTSCEDEPEKKLEKEPENTTTLKINNESGVYIYSVKWHGIEFYRYYMFNSINPGETITKSVSPGSGYIFFKDGRDARITYQTVDLVVVGKNENVEFTFTNNTIIKDSSGNNGPIKEVMK
jgi:PBP1b-binding outer membrane lipoprotein LpoB